MSAKAKAGAPRTIRLNWLDAAHAALASHPNRQFLKALVLELSTFGPAEGDKVNPTRATLMDRLKASERSVDRGLGQLVELGVLSVVKTYGRAATWYRRTIPSTADEQYKAPSTADEQYEPPSTARPSTARPSAANEQHHPPPLIP